MSEIVARLRASTVIPLYLAAPVPHHDVAETRDVIVKCTRTTPTGFDFEFHAPERDAPEQAKAIPRIAHSARQTLINELRKTLAG